MAGQRRQHMVDLVVQNGAAAEMKKLFPSNCRFANHTINIKAVRDDTGIEFLATVPVCTVETNWKDF